MWNDKTINDIKSICNEYSELKDRPDREDGVVDLNYIDKIGDMIEVLKGIKSEIMKALYEVEKVDNICKSEHDKYLGEVREMMERRGIIAEGSMRTASKGVV